MTAQFLPPHPPLEKYYRAPDDRRAFVTTLFDRTAPYYDSINRVMSAGSGLMYRREALQRAGLAPGMRVLDVAVGTGLTARAAMSTAGRSVMGVDASGGMLEEAKALEIPLVRGLAEALPLGTGSFDFLTMGYGLRHVSDLEATFSEFRRVLKPGGRILILELTRPPSGWRYWVARFYLQRVVPLLAQLGRGGRDARALMEYFWATIDGCVPPPTVIDALGRVGFTRISHHQVWIVCTEYTAVSEPTRR